MTQNQKLQKLAQLLGQIRLNEGFVWATASQEDYKDADKNLEAIMKAAIAGRALVKSLSDESKTPTLRRPVKT